METERRRSIREWEEKEREMEEWKEREGEEETDRQRNRRGIYKGERTWRVG